MFYNSNGNLSILRAGKIDIRICRSFIGIREQFLETIAAFTIYYKILRNTVFKLKPRSKIIQWLHFIMPNGHFYV